MAFIEKADNRPFFVYLNYTVPHAELRVPDDSIEPFKGKFPEKPFVNAPADARQSGPDEPSLGYRSQPVPHAAFAAMISRMDRDVGRIVDVLRARGMAERTLVIFSSDNGPHQGRRRRIRNSSTVPAGSAASSATCTRAASECR